MAGLKVHTGPVEALHYLDEVPRERWSILATARRGFVQSSIPYDCRALVRFVEDAEQMYEPLGYASAAEFIRQELGIEPLDAEKAIIGLQALGVDKPQALKLAIEAAVRVQQLAAEAKPAGPRGVRRDSSNHPATLTDTVDNIKSGNLALQGGTSAAYLTARIARDRPDVLEQMKAGAFPSVRAAARAAGILREPTPLERALKAYGKLSAEERDTFRREMDGVKTSAPLWATPGKQVRAAESRKSRIPRKNR